MWTKNVCLHVHLTNIDDHNRGKDRYVTAQSVGSYTRGVESGLWQRALLGAPSMQDNTGGNDESLLMSLCEAGQQSVTITGVYKRNVDLMFMHSNTTIQHLEDVVLAPALCDKTIKWSVRFLVDKGVERVPLQSHPEHPTTNRPL